MCPKNQQEVNNASERLGCGSDKYDHKQYLCIPNYKKTSLVEFCFDGVLGIQNKLKVFVRLTQHKITCNIRKARYY